MGVQDIEQEVLARRWKRFYPKDVSYDINVPKMMYHELMISKMKGKRSGIGAIFAGSTFTNGELLELSMRLATFLRGKGIGEGSRVGLVLPNSPQFIIAYLATLSVGATVVPMNPLYKAPELNYIIKKADADLLFALDLFYDEVRMAIKETKVEHVVVTNIGDILPPAKRVLGKLLGKIPSRKVPRDRRLYSFAEALRSPAMSEKEVYKADPDEKIAALCFTSGTTGAAKGVMLSHGNLVANVLQCHEFARPFLSDDERVLAVLPFFHIYGQTAIMGLSLSSGYTLVILPKPDLEVILNSIERYRVTVVFGVPALYNALITHPNFRRETFSNVKLCISGADKLHPEIARRFEDATGLKIVEGYGLTEASPVTHLNPPDSPRLGSIGVPLPNTYAWIARIDGDELLPIGETGELIVSGPQVMKGYLDDPRANAEVFLVALGRKWIRTGDVAKMDEDGFFYVLERKKDLIKYKGWSIYPAEIENVVMRHEAVKSAAVVGVPDVEVGERVVCFVALKQEFSGKVNEQDLKEWCRRNLAPFQVPERIIFKDELPVSMTGKILRRVLREEAIDKLQT